MQTGFGLERNFDGLHLDVFPVWLNSASRHLLSPLDCGRLATSSSSMRIFSFPSKGPCPGISSRAKKVIFEARKGAAESLGLEKPTNVKTIVLLDKYEAGEGSLEVDALAYLFFPKQKKRVPKQDCVDLDSNPLAGAIVESKSAEANEQAREIALLFKDRGVLQITLILAEEKVAQP